VGPRETQPGFDAQYSGKMTYTACLFKLLKILWLNKLPERDHQTLTVYARDRLPDDQDPQVVNNIFDTNSDKLAVRCTGLAPPKWLTKEAKAIKVSLESFVVRRAFGLRQEIPKL